MINYIKLILLASLVLAVIYGCAKSHQIRQKDVSGEVVHDTFRILSGRSYEECIELRPGMAFDYDFWSSNPVNFNIHYHGEEKIHYPVNKKGIKKDKGHIDPTEHEYYIEDQEFYCLMWDNTSNEAARVSFTCVLNEKK